jgi:hypothetical protein
MPGIMIAVAGAVAGVVIGWVEHSPLLGLVVFLAVAMGLLLWAGTRLERQFHGDSGIRLEPGVSGDRIKLGHFSRIGPRCIRVRRSRETTRPVMIPHAADPAEPTDPLVGERSLLRQAWDRSALDLGPRQASPDDESGRGLAVVAGLSARWGCQRTGQ